MITVAIVYVLLTGYAWLVYEMWTAPTMPPDYDQ